ncbi:MAG: hypothetical protein CVU97_03740 [Firmicutes bacterium HGW-Firmicutes-21]|nr:MAG: hypothetical protein CVU97_03740 [Firmicutes bacterium HGW-Firmicutes-21]
MDQKGHSTELIKHHKQKNRFKDARRSLFILSTIVVFILLFYCIAALFTSVGYETFLRAKDVEQRITAVTGNNYEPLTIILDPGHGGEDPGAVANGFIEKELNLEVAFKLYELLSASGYNVVLTRDTDKLLYEVGEENHKKLHDLKNRLRFTQNFDNCIYVGIHMNKFPIESCKGLQTFYSRNNPLSQSLAQSVQDSTKLLLKENKRVIKPDKNNIYILERAEVPAVLIECGFLSNQAEAELLSDKAYQEKLAFTIFCGIIEFLGTEERT